MAGDETNYGALFLQGWDRGIGLRRNIEETYALIEEREMRKQADALYAEQMKGLEQQQANTVLARDRAEALEADMEAGLPVSDAEINRARLEVFNNSIKMLEASQASAIKLGQSGNRYAVEFGQKMLEQSMTGFAQISQAVSAQQQLQAQERMADKGEAGLDRRQSVELGARKDMQQTEIEAEAAQGAANRRTQMGIAGMEAGLKSRELTQRAFQHEDEMGLRDRQMKLAEDEARNPVKQVENIVRIGNGISALRGQGLSDQAIDKMLPEGVSVADYENKYSQLSEGVAAKIQDLEKYKARLEKRAERGEKVEGPLRRTQEQISYLERLDDMRRDAELEWEQFSIDAEKGEVAAAEFQQWVQQSTENTKATLAAPFRFLGGMVSDENPKLRKPEKEARESAKKANY